MDWRKHVESAKTAAKTAHERGTQIAGDVIDEHWPAIQEILQKHIAPAAKAIATNDELIELAAKEVHGHLPLPVRLVIRPKRLAGWCTNNRDRILAAIRPSKTADPAAPGEPG